MGLNWLWLERKLERRIQKQMTLGEVLCFVWILLSTAKGRVVFSPLASSQPSFTNSFTKKQLSSASEFIFACLGIRHYEETNVGPQAKIDSLTGARATNRRKGVFCKGKKTVSDFY